MIWIHASEAISVLSLVAVELQVGMKKKANRVYCLTECVMTCQLIWHIQNTWICWRHTIEFQQHLYNNPAKNWMSYLSKGYCRNPPLKGCKKKCKQWDKLPTNLNWLAGFSNDQQHVTTLPTPLCCSSLSGLRAIGFESCLAGRWAESFARRPGHQLGHRRGQTSGEKMVVSNFRGELLNFRSVTISAGGLNSHDFDV